MDYKCSGRLSLAALVLAAGLLLSSCGEKAKPENPATETTGLSVGIVPENPVAGDEVRAVVFGGGDEVRYRWELNGGEISGVAADVLPKGVLRKGDTLRVTAFSMGDEGSSEVVIGNSPPRLKSLGIRPARFGAGTELAAAVDGFDPDGDYVVYDYLWSINGERAYSATGHLLDGKAYKRGDKITLRVVPRDSEGPGDPLEAEAGYVINSPPVFKSMPPKDFAGNFIYSVEASDPDGDSVKLALEKSPKGMKLEGAKVVWDARDEKGSFEVVLSADDGNGGRALQEFGLTLKRD